ncbi:EAL domain-containing protein [Anaeroselena agilis]|uniref:EAL domain-containing protein n=1 Tax=Anaeroselena agilis TaxID=3063788 RepID=A0ABU3NZD3_9FIRM|nr:EAL domain-containing protein [Selenomonadales bacterium 4137-cl]
MTILAMAKGRLPGFFGRTGRRETDTEAVKELKKIIGQQAVTTVFQPIVSLTDGSVIGYEALSRGPRGSMLERPDALFSAAAEGDLIWELEYLCRTKALEKAKDIVASKMLFINVDPKIIDDHRFQKGLTRELLQNYCAETGNIIFEITEKTAISDYRSFCRILENYKSQGYRIAIDDTGAGYSGLKTLAQTRPHFIKVDMDLVRDIDKDGLKQAMMKALRDISAMTGSQIIAEGIETRDELAALIAIGIPYGQGFFLQKPAFAFVDIAPGIRETIAGIYRGNTGDRRRNPRAVPVGEIVPQGPAIAPGMQVGRVLDYFAGSPQIQGLPVVDGGVPVGLVMKNDLFARLAGNYGKALYMNRPVRLLMNRQPLVVGHATPLGVVAERALARAENNVYDHILVEREGKYYGAVPVKLLLEKMVMMENGQG